MRRRLECEISGRVQLVMYRDFAQRHARKLGLSGAARNLPDGPVGIVAEAEEDVLQQYLEILKEGPLLANVTDISVRWLQPEGLHADFSISYDR